MNRSHTFVRFLSMALAAVLLSLCALPAFAATYPYDALCMQPVNLRSRANTTSTILKRIKAGDTIQILGVTGSFYRVSFDGSSGYAMKVYVDGTDNAADPAPAEGLTQQAPPAVTGYPYDTTLIGYVKLRKTAEAKGEVIKMLTTESVVTVLSLTSNGFAKVKCDGKTGYVLASYVVLADIAAPTPTPGPTVNPDAQKYTELKKGSAGDAVKALQNALIELDYLDDKADGKFGAKTEAALKVFQKRNGLTQDGVASQTLQLLLYEGTPKNYKGYRKVVKTLAPVAGATIRKDSVGAAVERLQKRLKELGYYAGQITGACDAATLDAIESFQIKHNLVTDGDMNADEQAILYGATAMGASVVVTPTPAPTAAPPSTTVRSGDKGDDVKLVQQRLKELGYYTGNVTGTFNTASVAALKSFQTKSGLTADGVCGPVTRTVLFGQYALYAVATAMPVVTQAPVATAITEDNVIIIVSGSRGEAVLRLQTRLQELGYYLSRLDGVYLTDDITAVRAFQTANGLKVDGKAGYQTQSLLYSTAAIRGSAATGGTTTAVLRYGSVGAEVTTLQNKLIELGYLTGAADGQFGRATKEALISFQTANSLTRDGVAGAKTLAALYGASAQSNKVTTASTLRQGDVSDAVKTMQSRLIALGYLKGSADGNFGAKTSLALIAFQKANGLSADGVAGSKTLVKLNSASAVSSVGDTSTTTTAAAPTVGSVSAANVRYANWYTEVKARCKLYPNATVYDFTTGISWKVNMFSLGAHADSEPLTAEDTANMNRAFGGKTTWTAKAVWVVFSDGRVYMGSTHNTPHGTSHIRNNNFSGHLCIHFPRTQAQVEAIGSYATSHQKAIDLGWTATLKRATY